MDKGWVLIEDENAWALYDHHGDRVYGTTVPVGVLERAGSKLLGEVNRFGAGLERRWPELTLNRSSLRAAGIPGAGEPFDAEISTGVFPLLAGRELDRRPFHHHHVAFQEAPRTGNLHPSAVAVGHRAAAPGPDRVTRWREPTVLPIEAARGGVVPDGIATGERWDDDVVAIAATAAYRPPLMSCPRPPPPVGKRGDAG